RNWPASNRSAACSTSAGSAARYSPATSRTSSEPAAEKTAANESMEENRSCDMTNSSDRAGLPETGTGTPKRSCQGSVTAARPQAHECAQALPARTVCKDEGNRKPAAPHSSRPHLTGKRSAQRQSREGSSDGSRRVETPQAARCAARTA